MPYAEPGEKISFSTSKFTKLKSQGEKIRFRLIGKPFYDGKHFMKDNKGEWDVIPCVRINEGEECVICEKFFKAHAKAKKDGLDDKAKAKLTRPFSAAIAFYFPIINRKTEKFEIFQTTQGVRNDIEAERDLGTKVLDVDFDVIRTEKPGSYYKLSRVDSAEIIPLSKEEKVEKRAGLKIDLSDYISGQEEEAEEEDMVV